MNYYELSVRFNRRNDVFWSPDDMLPFADVKENNAKRFYKDLCKEINDQLENDTDRKTNVYAHYAEEGIVRFIYEADLDEIRKGKIRDRIRGLFKDKYGQADITLSKQTEISCESYLRMGHLAERKDYIYNFDNENMNVFEHQNHYTAKEAMIPEKVCGRTKMLEQAKENLADESFLDEIGRIYSDKNEKRFLGNPVHYLLNVTSRDSVGNMLDVLGQSLYANKRLLGRRITRFSDINERCYDEEEFEESIARSAGNLVAIELDGTYEDHGNYASAFHQVVEYIGELFRKYQRNTLFVFVKNAAHPGFADTLIEKVAEDAKIVEIREGGGDADEILRYVRRMARREGQPVHEADLKKAIGDKKYYKIGEAHEIYNKYFSNSLMYKVYKAYDTCACLKIDGKRKNTKPYEELQKMIGLNEVKKMTDSIINNAKIQKMRSRMGMDSFHSSLHMVFTGNPGSAKTTVARLLAQILAKENVIEMADIVECGRSDLVGKYVGWTAKEVKSKFREAKGGILFIDEAYSLLEHWEGSYGDEAINTIVQEMENHRDDVIVIFAGYPEKMKNFLERNEGLRSRITFHLDFPDYDPEELLQILQLMADQKGLSLEPGVTDKCREIFAQTVNQKDFGNGRFVRNLLEQAVMQQANRLAESYKGKNLSRKVLTTLRPEDFDVNAGKQNAEKKRKIGFVA